MKKTLLIIFVVLLIGVSGTVFAGTVSGYAPDSLSLGTAGDLPLTVKLSKNVEMRIDLQAVTAPAPVSNYVMSAYHDSGSRTFATSNLDQKIWYKDGTGTTMVPPDVPSTTTPPDFTGANWLPL